MRYDIVIDTNLNDLMAEVNRLLKGHWQVHGSLVVFEGVPPAGDGAAAGKAWGKTCLFFAQPMILQFPYGHTRQDDSEKQDALQLVRG